MKCHEDHKNEENQLEQQEQHKKHGMGKHMILMILCCSIPIILLLLLPLLNIEGDKLRNLFSIGIFLLCPLLHIVMMGGMMKHGKKK